ncbi:MAG: peptidoglycan-binding protein, partial [Alphaproteobacteria bacterium]|nr:peptidoglycan-binding protein [Alphaproteobacteria bacterium]
MAKFDTLAPRYMRDLIRDFDITDFQAAGIVGNGGGESAGFTKIQEERPTVKGSAGGLGHFQWTGRTKKNPRRANFEKLLADNADKGWTAHTYEANYAMLSFELLGPEKAALVALKRTTDIDEATEVFCRKFERPGIPHLESRKRWAARAMKAYRKSEAQPETAEPKDAITDEKVIRLQQQYLNNLKYHCGEPDGKIGPLTKSAIRDFRADNGLKPMPRDGEYFNDEMVIALQKAPRRVVADERAEAGEKQVANKFTMVLALIRARLYSFLMAVGAV